MAMETKAPPHGMKMDPRLEVAQELKQHLIGLALTHRKMVAGMKPKKPSTKGHGVKPEGDDPEDAGEID